MARNVEIKARARDFRRQAILAQSLAKGGVEYLVQEDTFFRVPIGRLKLRVFEDGSGELIQYEREDSLKPIEAHYTMSRTEDTATLKEALARSLGVYAVVRKTRTVYLYDQTRIHLDQVEGLGEFIELEVVIDETAENNTVDDCIVLAERLMAQLAIDPNDLIAEAYVDMLDGVST